MEASALLEEAAGRGETAELDGLLARLAREVDDLVAEIGDETGQETVMRSEAARRIRAACAAREPQDRG